MARFPGGVVEESTGRTHDRLPKRSDGIGGTPAKPNDKLGKTVNFTMSKHHESCTNATGSENGEPGRLNHRNRAYGREDMVVRSIVGKTVLSDERSLLKAFGSGERESALAEMRFLNAKAPFQPQ